MGDAKQKVAVTGIVSILLVAAVVGVAVTVSKKNGAGSGADDITTSTKASSAICSPADYKEACERSVSHANTSDPKSLIQAALNYTVDSVSAVLKNSTLLKDAAADKSTKDALAVCEEVLDRAVDDLRRSIDNVGQFDASKAEEIVEDLRTWLSAVITYEETCIDAFENTTGETGEKMKQLLKDTKELSSNGLAMVTDISSILVSLQVGTAMASGSSAASRKLLWAERRQLNDLKPNAVVALDGSGQFKSINKAIAMVPQKNTQPFVIFVKTGIYKEYVEIPKNINNVVLIGEGPLKTRITGNKNYIDGVKTFQSATVAVNGEDFTAKDIAFENSAGPEKHQAVALRVSGDRAVFHGVHIDGYQDSLYTHTYRQFYRACQISGTVDFIFGDSLSIFQKCTFVVRKPMDNQACMVTAQGRMEEKSQGAILIHGGSIVAEPALMNARPPIKAYLGRPWKQLSRTIIMFTNIGGFIAPEGWSVWNGNFALNTLYYAEYKNTGPGADQSHRVNWKGIRHFTDKEAQEWTMEKQFQGEQWFKNAAVPYWPNLNTN